MTGRRVVAPLAAVLAVAGLAACGGSDKKDKTTSTATHAARTTTTPGSVPTPPPPKLPTLGAIQTMPASTAGRRGKTLLRVKVSRFVRKLEPAFLQAPKLSKGARYVGVQMTVINVGKAPWTGQPGQAGVLITSADTQAGKVAAVGKCGGAFAKQVQISTGERQRGCLAFVLQRKQKPKTFQFAPDQPASPPAEWSLTK